jgi:hypothetical protein
MDEYDQGMEPGVKAYLKKVINSFIVGAMWLIITSTLGLFFGMAIIYDHVRWFNIAFYIFFLLSFLWLMRYYYKKWKGDFNHD